MNFLDWFSTNIQISDFMKIRQVVADFFRADKRTEGQKDGQT